MRKDDIKTRTIFRNTTVKSDLDIVIDNISRMTNTYVELCVYYISRRTKKIMFLPNRLGSDIIRINHNDLPNWEELEDE